MTALKFGDLPGKAQAAEHAKLQAAFDKRVKAAMAHIQRNYGKLPIPSARELHGTWVFGHYGLDVLREAARRLRER